MEVFKLEFTGLIKLNETWPGNGSSSSIIHEISSPATLKLPIVCSVQSEEFSCGAVILWSADTKTVHTTHHRMIITQDSIVEDAVEMTNETFIGSTIDLAAAASLESASWFSSFSQAATSYQTPIIIVGSIVAAMLVMAIPAKLMINRSRETDAVNVNNYNSANSSSDNSKTVEIEMEAPVEPNCPSPPPAVVAPYNLAAIGEVTKEQMDVILSKAVHLRTPWEGLAVDKWTEQHGSN